jgi:ketosteroid isomerase-like protein
MTDDERAIRDLVGTWMAATKRGDLSTVLDLMTDDVVFMVPGQKPVFGDWACFRSYLEVTAIPPNGEPVRPPAYTLTIVRKEADGRWRLARDANLMTTQ